jgi:hypothetical protein
MTRNVSFLASKLAHVISKFVFKVILFSQL